MSKSQKLIQTKMINLHETKSNNRPLSIFKPLSYVCTPQSNGEVDEQQTCEIATLRCHELSKLLICPLFKRKTTAECCCKDRTSKPHRQYWKLSWNFTTFISYANRAQQRGFRNFGTEWCLPAVRSRERI